MSKYVIDDTTLSAIGDAVREKDGTTEGIKVSELASRILAIPAGGEDLPEEAFNITGSCQYKFNGTGWNWFLDNYGNRVTTNAISDASNMFYNNQSIKKIPFDININASCKSLPYMFYQCNQLEELPLIKGFLTSPTSDWSGTLSCSDLFNGCYKIKEIPYDYFHNFGGDTFWEASKKHNGNRNGMFSACYSLRKLPDMSMLTTKGSQYSNFYYRTFYHCYSLDEITNIPVDINTLTSNYFVETFANARRVKNITFQTNEDGSPIVANWKGQSIGLTSYTGYGAKTNWNDDITTDKLVKNDATYQALKDDPDWYSTTLDYCRYNHDSAVATINSLPDTSAYGTNTIIFYGAAGAKTDGGAINTLTEAEIAIAAAKGWTVTLV